MTKKPYTPKEKAEILKVSKDLPLKERRERLQAIATKYGREYSSVYALWNVSVMHANEKSSGNQPTVPVTIDDVKLYEIEDGVEIKNARTDLEPVKQKLEKAIHTMAPFRHTFPILKSQTTGLLKWLREHSKFQSIKFGTQTIPDNPKVVRLFRKS